MTGLAEDQEKWGEEGNIESNKLLHGSPSI
jgi:hypothetical protein